MAKKNNVILDLDNTLISAIVVDDFRLFGIDKGWPKKSEVLAKLEAVFPEKNWQLSVHNDQFLVIKLPPAL